jgi:WD40 repeat protein
MASPSILIITAMCSPLTSIGSQRAPQDCLPFVLMRRVAAVGLLCLALLAPRGAMAQDRAATDAARAESLAAALRAQILLARHDTLGAMAAAYRGLPEHKGAAWPDVAQTRAALLSAYAESHLVAAYDRKASAAALSRDGKRIAMALKDGVEVRSLEPDARLAVLKLPARPAGADDATSDVGFVDLSADGRHVVAANAHDYWVWRLDGANDLRAGSCGDGPGVDTVRFVGDGDHVLVKCGTDLNILASSDLHSVLALHEVEGFDVSRDGRLITTGKDVRSIADGRIVLTLPASADSQRLVALAPDAQRLAVASDKTVEIFNLASAANATPEATVEVQSAVAISWLTFSPDGNSLVTVNYGEIRIFDAASGDLTAVWSDNRTNLSAEVPGPDRAFVSADGRWLLTASTWQDGMFTTKSSLWSLVHREDRPVTVTRGEAELLPVAFTRAAAPMFVTVDKAAARGGVFVWSADSALQLHRWADDVTGSAELIAAATPSNDIIIKGAETSALTRCRLDTFACAPAPASALAALDSVITTPRGMAMLSVQDQSLVATLLAGGAIAWRRELAAAESLDRDFKVFNRGADVLWSAGAGTKEAKLSVLRAADGVPRRMLADASAAEPLAGPLVVVAKRPKGFALVDVDTGRTTPLDLPGDTLGPVAIARDGAHAAIVTSFDQSVDAAPPGQFLSVIATQDGHVVHSRRIAEPDGYSHSIGFSPDGRSILLGGRIIDAASGDGIAVLDADTEVPVHSSQFSPDGRLIFALYDAGLAHTTSLRIFAAADGMLLQTYLTSPSLLLQFSPDGNAFVTQDYDGLRVLLTPTPAAIAARARRLLDGAGLLAR